MHLLKKKKKYNVHASAATTNDAHTVIVNIVCAIIAAVLSAFLWLNVINLLLWASADWKWIWRISHFY